MKLLTIRWIAAVMAVLLVYAIRAGADEAPGDILAAMRPGGVSKQFGAYNADKGNGRIEFHVYGGPAGHEKVPQENGDLNASNRPDRLYYVDAYSRSGGVLHLANTTFFTMPYRFRASSETSFKWLKPKLRSSPILISIFGESDGRAEVLVTYPDGISGEAYVQVLESGGEGDGGNGFSFDTVDGNGLMAVTETVDSENPRSHKVNRTYWTGDRFAAKGQSANPYFVIGASVKTRDEAEKYVRQNKLWTVAAIRQSSHFGLLQPGYFIVTVGSGASEAKAAALQRKYKKRGIACYVKKAI